MSQSEIERLIGDLPANETLREGLKGDDFDAALTAVRDAGYAIEADEARAFLSGLAAETRQELNDENLDAVTGGAASGVAWHPPEKPSFVITVPIHPVDGPINGPVVLPRR